MKANLFGSRVPHVRFESMIHEAFQSKGQAFQSQTTIVKRLKENGSRGHLSALLILTISFKEYEWGWGARQNV